jgi:hypothetical protein
MPKRGRMFAGITRQVVISDETHRSLFEAAQDENKYIGELADELICEALLQRQRRVGRSPQRGRAASPPPALPESRAGSTAPRARPGQEASAPVEPQQRGPEPAGGVVSVERLALQTSRAYYKYHCLVCERDWIGGGEEAPLGTVGALPKRCNYQDCRATAWNDPIAATVAREKRRRRHGHAVY